jgi:CubicO group peptidase (beta-lactamase class C family)
MAGGSRSLPSRPSLRYLRLEAKRRLAAAEFPSLHDAQAAIAWEHGLPSWAVLKQRICAEPGPESYALAQLRWLISRFSGADQPGWTAPGDDEMRAHFADRFLAVVPAGRIIEATARIAPDLRGELTVIAHTSLAAQVQLAGIRYLAAVDAVPPYRLLGLQGFPVGERITDARLTAAGRDGDVASPPARTLGAVPAELAGIAGDALAELGLPGLVLAGGEPDGPSWAIAQGWADLDRPEVLDLRHRFPAVGVTALATTTAVLRLVAEGRFGLDTPVNDQLRTARLAHDAITVRDLLSHTSGVDSPAEVYGDRVRDLAALMGPVVPCRGPRGEFRPGNGAYAVLGQLIADVTRTPFADAVGRLVLDPLGMRDSRFPARVADIGTGAVSGYNVTPEGTFVPFTDQICTVQAAGGLWSTGADLVRLGTGWSSLLPAALAREALTAQASGAEPRPGGYGPGLGWLLSARGDTAAHQGIGLDSAASLFIRVRDHRTHVVLTNRQMTVESLDDRLLRAWTNPQGEAHVPALSRQHRDAGNAAPARSRRRT